jgi:hypothetical protein
MLTSEEQDRVRDALDKLQAAQYLIDDAAQALCPVNGFAREWSASGKVHDAVKRYWHRVEARRQQLTPRRTA